MLGRARITLACALGACALFGCAPPPGAQAIVGPTGQPMAHVHCGADQGQCFRIAGELCPKGYDIQPVLSGADGNFLVRCHAAPIAVSTPTVTRVVAATAPAATTPVATTPPPSFAAPPTAPAKTTEQGPREQPAPQVWPPAAEPGPAANPWADRDRNATAGASNKSPPIDVGY